MALTHCILGKFLRVVWAAHCVQKNSECKNPLEIFLLRLFGIKVASSSLIIFQRAELSTRSITHLWTPRGGHQGSLVLPRQCPGSPGTCNPDETGLPGFPVSWSPTLFSGSGPVRLPPVPWTEKNNWKVSIFRPTRRSLQLRRPAWTDNVLNFLFVWFT